VRTGKERDAKSEREKQARTFFSDLLALENLQGRIDKLSTYYLENIH